MKEAFKLINNLMAKGLIEDYAIGGAVAAIFYTEPFLTSDLDVFVIVKLDPGKKIISFSEIYDELKGLGYNWEGEYFRIGGTLLQFIPVSSDLEDAAVRMAQKVSYYDVSIKVMMPEYLIALFLKIGRWKDKEKIRLLLSQTKIDRNRLNKILKEHRLYEKFKKENLDKNCK